MDFTDYKFRCHYLAELVGSWYNQELKPALTEKQTEDYKNLLFKEKRTAKQEQTLADYEAKLEAKKSNVIEISQSTKSVLHTIWNEEVVKTKPVLKSKAVRRGKNQEPESIDLVNKVFGIKMSKNEKRFENDFFTGEPDLITDKSIIDIKTCESWETFWSKTEKKANDDYFWQVWAYMLLTGKEQGFIAYTLPSYDDNYIQQYAQPYAVDIEEENQIYLNLNFDRIPKDKRVKIFKIENREIDTQKIYNYLIKCRDYLNNLTTQFVNFQPLENK
jgi:hypothetical protein